MSEYYFYLHLHPTNSRTCYGITDNYERRLREYEGHTGDVVDFTLLIGANKSTIKELEKTLKNWILRLNVQWKSYEWIDSSVDYKSVVETVLYLLTDKEYKILKDG